MRIYCVEQGTLLKALQWPKRDLCEVYVTASPEQTCVCTLPNAIGAFWNCLKVGGGCFFPSKIAHVGGGPHT